MNKLFYVVHNAHILKYVSQKKFLKSRWISLSAKYLFKTLPEFQVNSKPLFDKSWFQHGKVDDPCCSTEHLKGVCKKQLIQIIKLDRFGLNLIEPVLGKS